LWAVLLAEEEKVNLSRVRLKMSGKMIWTVKISEVVLGKDLSLKRRMKLRKIYLKKSSALYLVKMSQIVLQ